MKGDASLCISNSSCFLSRPLDNLAGPEVRDPGFLNRSTCAVFRGVFLEGSQVGWIRAVYVGPLTIRFPNSVTLYEIHCRPQCLLHARHNRLLQWTRNFCEQERKPVPLMTCRHWITASLSDWLEEASGVGIMMAVKPRVRKRLQTNPDRVFISFPVPAFWVFHFWSTIYPVLTSPLPTKPRSSFLPRSPEYISCQWHWSTGSFPKGARVVFSGFVQAAVPPPIAVGSKPHPWVWVTSSQGLSGTFPALAQRPFVVVQAPSYVWLCATPHALGPKSQNIKQKQYCNKFNKDIRNGPHQK